MVCGEPQDETRLFFAIWLFIGVSTRALARQIFQIATNGSDLLANDTAVSPWASITYASDRAPDQSTTLVRPGTFTGRICIHGQFDQVVTMRPEVPHQTASGHSTPVWLIGIPTQPSAYVIELRCACHGYLFGTFSS